MSDSEKISITLKAGQGFDSPWIVVHADTAQEAANLLDAVHLTGLGLRAATVAKGFQAEYAASELGVTHVSTTPNAPAQTVQAPAPAPTYAAPAAPAALPHDQQTAGGGGNACEHGAYIWKDFVSKAGRPIKGWFCPSPNRTSCAAKFVN